MEKELEMVVIPLAQGGARPYDAMPIKNQARIVNQTPIERALFQRSVTVKACIAVTLFILSLAGIVIAFCVNMATLFNVNAPLPEVTPVTIT